MLIRRLDFRDFVFERLPAAYHEGFIALAEVVRQHFLETDRPFLLGDDDWDMPLNYPGRHVKPLLKKKDNQVVIKGPQDNSLIPVHAVQWMAGNDRTGKAKGMLSHFVREQPMIAAFSQSGSDNMAATIIFVLLTIRATFTQVMQDFPTLMLFLMGKFQDQELDQEGSQLHQMVGDFEQMLSQKGQEKGQTRGDFKLGYGLGGSLFGWDRPFNKYKSVSTIWNRRDEIYQTSMEYVDKKDTVGLFSFLLRTISGLGLAKVGFVVQLLFGELGCIDMHNVNLYSQYYTNRRGLRKSHNRTFPPDHLMQPGDELHYPTTDTTRKWRGDPNVAQAPEALRNMRTYRNLGAISSKSIPNESAPSYQKNAMAAINRYMDVIGELEKDGVTTIKLWDYWVSYVAHIYSGNNSNNSGGRRSAAYATTGALSGPTIDVEDPADEKFLGIRDRIPDRAAHLNKDIVWRKGDDGVYRAFLKGGNDPIKSYGIAGVEKERGAGSASIAHNAVWWWRNKHYWYNLLQQAENTGKFDFQEPPEGMRYAKKPQNFTASYLVAKPLAYLALDSDLQTAVFPDGEERREFVGRLDDALRTLGFFTDNQWVQKINARQVVPHSALRSS